MPGLLDTAIINGEAFKVGMNEISFIPFTSQSPIRSIGTADLNSCTAVMIVSSSGAILAYIAPRPPNARIDDPHAGDNHVTQKMNEMGGLYKKYQAYFSSDKPSWIVSAFYQGELALPSQNDIITSKLRKWGLNPTSENYNVVVQPPLPENGKGTVFIDARYEGFPAVYVEDRQVNRLINASIPTPVATAPAFAAPSSSSWNTQPSALQAAGSSTELTTPHYFYENKKYYWYEDGETSYEGEEVPLNAWIYNENGWSKSPEGKKWRWWSGHKATFSPKPTSDPGSGSGSGSSSSPALQAAGSSTAPTVPHYLVENKEYYWYEDGEKSYVGGEVPLNVWVYNKNGWSKGPEREKWRWWNGQKATFSHT